jgi:hypothetical protein
MGTSFFPTAGSEGNGKRLKKGEFFSQLFHIHVAYRPWHFFLHYLLSTYCNVFSAAEYAETWAVLKNTDLTYWSVTSVYYDAAADDSAAFLTYIEDGWFGAGEVRCQDDLDFEVFSC